jgi:hypothetical protein
LQARYRPAFGGVTLEGFYRHRPAQFTPLAVILAGTEAEVTANRGERGFFPDHGQGLVGLAIGNETNIAGHIYPQRTGLSARGLSKRLLIANHINSLISTYSSNT